MIRSSKSLKIILIGGSIFYIMVILMLSVLLVVLIMVAELIPIIATVFFIVINVVFLKFYTLGIVTNVEIKQENIIFYLVLSKIDTKGSMMKMKVRGNFLVIKLIMKNIKKTIYIPKYFFKDKDIEIIKSALV